MPYVEANWLRFLDGVKNRAGIETRTLCKTESGRRAEYALIRRANSAPALRIALACRHHACEMMASYALEGLIGWVLDDPSEPARRLRERAEFLAVPFMDKDGVEGGDQGKFRGRRDHNRDYDGAAIYATTRAFRELLPKWSAGAPLIGLDLHCPWISGPHNEEIYLVGTQDPRNAAEQMRFSEILESAASGPLRFRAAGFLPFGEAWNVAGPPGGGEMCARWLAALPNARLGTTIEIPYARALDAEVNQQTARSFGADLGAALCRYAFGMA